MAPPSLALVKQAVPFLFCCVLEWISISCSCCRSYCFFYVASVCFMVVMVVNCWVNSGGASFGQALASGVRKRGSPPPPPPFRAKPPPPPPPPPRHWRRSVFCVFEAAKLHLWGRGDQCDLVSLLWPKGRRRRRRRRLRGRLAGAALNFLCCAECVLQMLRRFHKNSFYFFKQHMPAFCSVSKIKRYKPVMNDTYCTYLAPWIRPPRWVEGFFFSCSFHLPFFLLFLLFPNPVPVLLSLTLMVTMNASFLEAKEETPAPNNI